ncbi:MAG: hypothetical protein V4484_19595 [Pseudomonadota bacterium]
MNITEQENIIFSAWCHAIEDPGAQFVIDGVPSPLQFEMSTTRCVFVLKEVNFSPADKSTNDFDLRQQLRDEPHPWWRDVARWCASISALHAGEQPTWESLTTLAQDKELMRQALQPFAFMQMKKTTGGGMVVHNDFNARVDKDAARIVSQLALYRPKIIIGCGIAEHLVTICGGGGLAHDHARSSLLPHQARRSTGASDRSAPPIGTGRQTYTLFFFGRRLPRNYLHLIYWMHHQRRSPRLISCC